MGLDRRIARQHRVPVFDEIAARLGLEPVDDLAAGGLPNTSMGTDVAEHFVEMPDAPRLPHDPRVQMQYHQPAIGRAIGNVRANGFALFVPCRAIRSRYCPVHPRIDADLSLLLGLTLA